MDRCYYCKSVETNGQSYLVYGRHVMSPVTLCESCASEPTPMMKLSSDLEKADNLLKEIYESQPSACIGTLKLNNDCIGPCLECLWCRVREHLSNVRT